MNLSKLSVKRGVTFAMVFLVVLGFGLYSLSRLQLDLYPEINFPTVVVITQYEGASPRDIETLVTKPIEGSVSAADGVAEMESTSRQGTSVVEVNFDWGKDMEQAETDVRRKLELVEAALPDDAEDPLVVAFDPSMQPVVILTMTGPYSLAELRRIAEDEVQPRLERIDGVATAEVAGGLVREIQVRLDPSSIEAYGLDVNTVLGAIYQENVQKPGGSIAQGKLDFTIQTQGKYESIEEIGEVLVGTRSLPTGIEVIRLSDVATIVDTHHESQRILEADGLSSVRISVRKQSDANTVKAAEAVMAELPSIAGLSGSDVQFNTIYNQADFINSSLGNLSNTGLLGVGIAFLVLLVFLRSFTSAAIVATAIPISVVATFAVMDQAGMTLNVISMAGLALAIGMLVDNAIVVLENIFRLREKGVGLWKAAIEGASSVSNAVTASTLTTVAVFIPILFVPGIAGVMFRDMAITICFALAVSLLVALTFIPLAASRLLTRSKKENGKEAPVTVGGFELPRRIYGRALDGVLAHRWTVGVSVAALLVIAGLLGTTIRTDFMASNDDSRVVIDMEAPVGSSLMETEARVEDVTAIVETTIPASERVLIAVDAGQAEGFTSIFSSGMHSAQIEIPLVAVGDRERSKQQIQADLRDRLSDIPGVTISTGGQMDSMTGEGDIEVLLRGHDLEVSRILGNSLADRLAAMPEIAEVDFSMQEQKPEVRVAFNRAKMTRLGLSTNSVGTALSTMFMGQVAGRYSEGGDEHDILVRYDKQHRGDVDEIGRMPVATKAGDVIPLMNLADVSMGLAPVDIERLDQERVTSLVLTLEDKWVDDAGKSHRKDLGATLGKVTDLIESTEMPEGFGYTIGGSAEDFATSFSYLGLALLVSVLLVFMVMASQFESLRQPLIIIFTVPLALLGVVGIFWLTNTAIDVSALIGVIMLVGIVVNNGIVMIDAANRLRARGRNAVEAIAEAARLRLRPVLLTSLTTILAMVPMALELGEGSAMWSGMARAVIGGLISATFLTLFVVPVLYTLLSGKTKTTASEAI